MRVLQDHNAYPEPRNVSKDYKKGKRKGEKYTDWVSRESDKAFIKFILWLVFGVPIALFLMGLIAYFFGG